MIRRFYGALWEAIDSLYPGHLAASGGPPRRDGLEELPLADDLLRRLTTTLGPELCQDLEKDYSRVKALLEEYASTSHEQRAVWLQEHEDDRERLLETTETYTRLIPVVPTLDP